MIEYLPNYWSQISGLLYSVGIGCALGFFYEALRVIFFITTGNDKKFTLARDIIFLLVCFAVNFLFLLIRFNGKVTFYAVAGETTGGLAVIRLTGSFFSYLVNRPLHRMRKRFATFFYKIKNYFFVFAEKIQNIEKNIKKTKKISKKALHNRHKMVYNQSVAVCLTNDERGDENGTKDET